MKVTTRLTSSLEKCFPTDRITDFAPLRERTVLGGDPFVVYPAPDGTPYESLRLLVFREVLDELRLMGMLASRIGKQKVLALVEEHLGTVGFDHCATASAPILALHEALLALI